MKHSFGGYVYFFVLVFSSFAITVTPGSAQTKDALKKSVEELAELIGNDGITNADLKNAIGELKAAVEKLLVPPKADTGTVLTNTAAILENNLKNKAIKSQVETLRAAVFAFEIQERDAFIGMLAGELQHTIEAKGDLKLGDQTMGALVGLSDVLAAQENANTKKALEIRVKQLKESIDGNDPVKEGDVEISGVDALLTTLLALEQNRFFSALRSRAAHLTGMVKTKPAEIRAKLRIEDLNNLAVLRGHLDTLIGDKIERHSGIHVVSAIYGRISGPKDAGGNCNARPTVVAACQAKDKCVVDADAFGKLCGGQDPAPLAESVNKGLLVRYVCLMNTPKNTWNELMRANSSNYAGNAISVVLRSEKDGIQCAVK